MLATANQPDFILIHFRNLMPGSQTALKKELQSIVGEIHKILASDKEVKTGIDILLPSVFSFRIKALNWLISEKESLINLLDEVYPQFEDLKKNQSLKELAENVLLALKCNHQVMESMVSEASVSKMDWLESLHEIPPITYQQLVVGLSMNAPEVSVQKFVAWMNASLYIELISLMTLIIHDDHLKVTREKINELSFLIANASKEYLLLAIEGGIIKPSPSGHNYFYEENQLLDGIQHLISNSQTFDFLKEEEEIYTLSDLKEIYNGKR